MQPNTNNLGYLYQPGNVSGTQEGDQTIDLPVSTGLKQLATDTAITSSPQIQAKIKELGLEAERMDRRLELLCPTSEDPFVAALWWMFQLGMEEDLDAIRHVKDTPPFDLGDITPLLKITEQEIEKRVNAPAYVMSKGEETFRLHRYEWEQNYGGEFIAIHRGMVVAHAPSELELMREITKVQKERGRFRAYIIEVGGELLQARGPRITIGLQKHLHKSQKNGAE